MVLVTVVVTSMELCQLCHELCHELCQLCHDMCYKSPSQQSPVVARSLTLISKTVQSMGNIGTLVNKVAD